MSQAVFERAAAGRHQALSAGTAPADRVHPEVIEVMNEIGIDLADQSPTLLTRELAQRADLLVTMGCGLPDPADQPIETVRAIRDRVDAQVQQLIAELDAAPADQALLPG